MLKGLTIIGYLKMINQGEIIRSFSFFFFFNNF